jgi:hypothetical protein
VLLLVIGVGALRRARGRWGEEPVLAGAVAAVFAGVVLMLVQSYVYSAGNIAMLSFWLCVGICATALATSRGSVE